MKDNKTKKEIISQYKERKVFGGIYAIRNTLSNKLLIGSTTDMQGSKNRFEFSSKTGSCVELKLQSDWNKQGAEQFVFEVLEELEKNETQTDKEFKADINALKDLWIEKLSDKELY